MSAIDATTEMQRRLNYLAIVAYTANTSLLFNLANMYVYIYVQYNIN